MTTLEIVILTYLVVHLFLCLIIYIGVRTHFLMFSEQLMPIIVLVPFSGIIIAFIADYDSRLQKNGTKPISLEELHLGIEDLRLKSIETNTEKTVVIPLEEAMLVNDAETRRKLMLEILQQNPEQYLSLLQEACMDDDIEVSHYASTAIMEMQRNFELALQKAEKEYIKNSDDSEKLSIYLACMERYIQSGLIDENVLLVYKKRYSELLKKEIKFRPEEMDTYTKAIDNCIVIKNYTEAKMYSDKMVSKWPAREETWLSALKVCHIINDVAGIKNVLDEVKRRNVFLTPTGKSIIKFWEQSKQ